MNIRLTAVLIAFAILIIQSCVNHEIPDLAGCSTLISFENEVKPIINSSCAKSGCHNGDLGDDRNWTKFEKFQAKRLEVKRRITLPDTNSEHMPQDGTLEQSQINTIVCWVDQGGRNN